VRIGKDLHLLNPHANQRIDVKKAAIAEIPVGGAPEGEAIILALEQGIQGIGIGIHVAHHGLDSRGNTVVLSAEARQLRPQDLLIAMAAVHTFLIRRRQRQNAEALSNESKVV
jgi:hypothetical protein